jgi:23S rRNA pseudouridine2457 synthase
LISSEPPRTFSTMIRLRTKQTFRFHKPYGVLSQFTHGRHGGHFRTLADFGPFPPDVYPVGRLDADSEGLLLLSSNPTFTQLLLDPRFRHPRTYLLQVEGIPGRDALQALREGSLLIDGKPALPARARLLDGEPSIPPRSVPIRHRKTIPVAWLELILFEGRNRQARKMTAAVGHPTLRLIRTAIGPVSLEGLEPGKWQALSRGESARLHEALRVSSSRVQR